MSAADASPEQIRLLFAEGVDAFTAAIEQAGAQGAGDRPACGVWTVDDVARHELDVIGWYHRWLDRALAGDATPEFPAADLDRRALAGVEANRGVTADEAVRRFRTEARRYLERVEPHRDVPYGYPRGTVTAGLHVAVAATEWHLHTWDVAGALGLDHQPSDAAVLWDATTACLVAALGSAPPPDDPDPWTAVLLRSGRHPRSGSAAGSVDA